MDGKITFEIHYEEGVLPEVFPEARTRVSRAAKAAAKAAVKESTEVVAVKATKPETEAAPEENPQTDEIPASQAACSSGKRIYKHRTGIQGGSQFRL